MSNPTPLPWKRAVGPRYITALAVLLMAMASSVVLADSDSLATLGFSGRMSYQTPGQTVASGEDYTFHGGLRLELFYLFGAEFEATYVPDELSGDIYRPSYRLTGHLHLMNFRYLDFYLGVGLASAELGDVVNIEGPSTIYRAGGGLEIIIAGHWALGVDAYWSVAGIGYFNKRLTESLQNDQGIPDPMEQVDPGQIEVGLALRYYL